MKTRQSKQARLAFAAVLVLTSPTLFANGETFFVSGVRGPVDLVYFARVKNSRTGRPIEKPPYVTIVDRFSGLIVPFQGDSAGHFRSPDIGKAIKEITTHTIDTQQLDIVVSASGYHTVKVGSIPRQSKGTIELNIRMDPKEGTLESAGAASQRGAPGGGTSVPADSAKPTILLLGSCFGIAAIAAVARTVGRPASTEH